MDSVVIAAALMSYAIFNLTFQSSNNSADTQESINTVEIFKIKVFNITLPSPSHSPLEQRRHKEA